MGIRSSFSTAVVPNQVVEETKSERKNVINKGKLSVQLAQKRVDQG